MKKHFIPGVPRYYEPHIGECFQNCLCGVLLYYGYDLKLIMTDYLSFFYNSSTGLIGTTFAFNNTFKIKENNNDSYNYHRFLHYPERFLYQGSSQTSGIREDRINVMRYYTDDDELADFRLKELIDGNIPVICGVDIFYLSYHNYYNNRHHLHYIIVTGYDEEKSIFEYFDYYKLINVSFDGSSSADIIKKARNSENPMENPQMKMINSPVRNRWSEIYFGKEFRIKDNDLLYIIKNSYELMTKQNGDSDIMMGLPGLEFFINSFEKKQIENIGENDIFLYKTQYFEAFRYISRNRKRFHLFIQEVSFLFSPVQVEELIAQLDESSKNWEIAARSILKFTMTKRKNDQDSLTVKLKTILENEKKIIENLGKIIAGKNINL